MVCLTLSGKLLMILNGLQKQKTKKKKILISLDNTVFECGFYFFSQTVDDYYRPHRR